MSSIPVGTKGFIYRPAASYLSAIYRPVTVVDTQHHMIWVVDIDDPDGDVRLFHETTRTNTSGDRVLILEGEPQYKRADKRYAYDTLVSSTAATVRNWSYDEHNPGKALQASEALRILASTPEPRKD